jgi:hypothetical protein
MILINFYYKFLFTRPIVLDLFEILKMLIKSENIVYFNFTRKEIDFIRYHDFSIYSSNNTKLLHYSTDGAFYRVQIANLLFSSNPILFKGIYTKLSLISNNVDFAIRMNGKDLTNIVRSNLFLGVGKFVLYCYYLFHLKRNDYQIIHIDYKCSKNHKPSLIYKQILIECNHIGNYSLQESIILNALANYDRRTTVLSPNPLIGCIISNLILDKKLFVNYLSI